MHTELPRAHTLSYREPHTCTPVRAPGPPLISRTDTYLSTCDLETGQAGREGCGCWEPQKPISQKESFLAGRRGSDYGVGVPGVKDVSQRTGWTEMVPSLGAARQRAETEHPAYQQGPISGVFHNVLAPPCPRSLRTPTRCQPRSSLHHPQIPRSPSPSSSFPLRPSGCRLGLRSNC